VGLRYDHVNNIFIYDEKMSGLMPNLMWHLTSECNLHCSFCFSKSGSQRKRIRIEDFKYYIKIFKNLGVQKVDISGGEPLLFDNLDLLCSLLSESKIFATITTSAFADDSQLEWLINNEKRFSRIILSLDAPYEDMHDSIRGQKGCFKKLLSLAKQLVLVSDRVRINTVCTDAISDKDTLNDFFSIITSMSLREWCLIQPLISNGMKDVFDTVVSIIDQMDITKVKIITRPNNIYSEYWVLEEDGMMFQRNQENNKYNIFSENQLQDLYKALRTDKGDENDGTEH